MNIISRRQFSQRLFRVLMAGGFAHFAVVGKVFADSSVGTNNDECPGGIAPQDVCVPAEGNEDRCPGERSPADECPPD